MKIFKLIFSVKFLLFILLLTLPLFLSSPQKSLASCNPGCYHAGSCPSGYTQGAYCNFDTDYYTSCYQCDPTCSTICATAPAHYCGNYGGCNCGTCATGYHCAFYGSSYQCIINSCPSGDSCLPSCGTGYIYDGTRCGSNYCCHPTAPPSCVATYYECISGHLGDLTFACVYNDTFNCYEPASCHCDLTTSCYSQTATSWMNSACGGASDVVCDANIPSPHQGYTQFTPIVCNAVKVPGGGDQCTTTITFSANCGTADTCHNETSPIPHGVAPGYCDCSSGGVSNMYKVCCNGALSNACSGSAHNGSCPNRTVRCNRSPSQCTYSSSDQLWHYNSDWNQICSFDPCPTNNAGADAMCSAIFSTSNTILLNTYEDLNANGARDAGEPAYNGFTVVLTGRGAGTYIDGGTGDTDGSANGTVVIQDVQPGASTATLTIPSGYVATTANPVNYTVNPPSTTVNFGIRALRYSISGYIFVDENKDTVKNAGESNYTGSPDMTVSICPGAFCSSGGTPITATNGVFNTGADALPPQTYTVSAGGLPIGYSITTPPTLAPTIGNPCSPSNGACDANYNVYNLHFGISNSASWIQTIGGDFYQAGGISNPIPENSACTGGPNMSITQAPINSPGIMFTDGVANFGQGYPSATLDNHWVVSSSIPVAQQTSYASLKSKAQASNITLITLPCASGSYATGCVLPSNLAKGVYLVNGDLKLAGTGSPASYTFPDSNDYVILVSGNLDIQTRIRFSANHNSTALFSAAGDIMVGGSVGETSATSSTPTIEGYFAAGRNFIVNNTLGNSLPSNCPTKDSRLNIEGAIVANTNGLGGSFQLLRDMCEDDLCPTVSIKTRPDFVLNAPLFYQSAARIWQEMAP